jgi:hypothetical protein
VVQFSNALTLAIKEFFLATQVVQFHIALMRWTISAVSQVTIPLQEVKETQAVTLVVQQAQAQKQEAQETPAPHLRRV